MRNVSGYLTDECRWTKTDPIGVTLQAWEKYKAEMNK